MQLVLPVAPAAVSESAPKQSRILRFSASMAGSLALFSVISALPLLYALSQRGTLGWPIFASVFCHVSILSILGVYLQHSGRHLFWSALMVGGLASLLSVSVWGPQDLSVLGEGIFLYILITMLAIWEHQADLQAIASVALLISAGVMTKPPIAIACLLISIIFFLLHRKRSRSGSIGFALLMFTPAALCISSAALLAFATGGVLGASAVVHGHTFGKASGLMPGMGSAIPVDLGADNLPVGWLIFPIGVVVYRIFARRSGASDVAFGFMLVVTALLSTIQGIPHPLQASDILYLAVGGGAALMAQCRFRRHLDEAILSAALLISAYCAAI